MNPNAFHAERRLIQSIAKATTLLDIQYDIDFYQHKNVVNSLFRGTLHFRASGKKIMSMAKILYAQAKKEEEVPS